MKSVLDAVKEHIEDTNKQACASCDALFVPKSFAKDKRFCYPCLQNGEAQKYLNYMQTEDREHDYPNLADMFHEDDIPY